MRRGYRNWTPEEVKVGFNYLSGKILLFIGDRIVISQEMLISLKTCCTITGVVIVRANNMIF